VGEGKGGEEGSEGARPITDVSCKSNWVIQVYGNEDMLGRVQVRTELADAAQEAAKKRVRV
jgi:hypothetical protein